MKPTWDRARAIADAVLYEGYLLYPYRATSSKNQSRWQFGVVGPPGASDAGIGEDDTLSAQFLIDGDGELTLVVRFLQLQHRRAERDVGDGRFEPVDELTSGTAVVGHVGRGGRVRTALRPLRSRRPRAATHLAGRGPGGHATPRTSTAAGSIRTRAAIQAELSIAVERDDGLHRVSVSVRNTGAAAGGQGRRHRHVADRYPRHRRSRWRRVRFTARTTRLRGGAGVPLRPAPVLPGARRATRRTRPAADLADHPLRPSRDRRAERGRALRLDRDRRDPHAPGDDDDRRGEGAGPRHRSAGGAAHRPVRCDVARGHAAVARHPAQSARREYRGGIGIRRVGRADEVGGPDPRDPRRRRLVGSAGRQRPYAPTSTPCW